MQQPFNFNPPEIHFQAIMPMVVVALTGVFALIIEMLRPKQNNNLIVGVSLGGLIVAAVAVFMQMGSGYFDTAAGMVRMDQFSILMQVIIIAATALTILFSEGYLREKRIPFGEFYPLLLWSALGAMIMAASDNLLVIFLGLEVLSIALYVMAGLARHEEKSEESALKYFLLGAFASGFFLYGIAFVYGATGSLNLIDVNLVFVRDDPMKNTLLLFGLGLLLVGLSFKASFAPFHQWTPDVYQGAPTNVTSFMAAGSKIGAFAALWRVLMGFSQAADWWLPALGAIAILTMTWGNLVALVQKDVKRVLGYSSISHAGYILVAILASTKLPSPNPGTLVYYLLAYSFMTVGAFAVVSMTARAGKEGTRFEDLNGLWRRSPFAAVAFAVFAFSLIGIPPSAGFFGKYFIFNDAIRAGLTPLAIVLAVNSIISTYYYLGMARAAFVSDESPKAEFGKMHSGLASACVLCIAGVVGIAVFYTPLMSALGLVR